MKGVAHKIASSAGGIGTLDILAEAESIVEASGFIIGGTIVATEEITAGDPPAEAVGLVADGFVAMAVIAVMVALLVFIAIVNVIYGVINAIPLAGGKIGSPLKSAVNWFTDKFIALAETLVDSLWGFMEHIYSLWFSLATDMGFGTTKDMHSYVSAYVDPIQLALNDIYGQVVDLEGKVYAGKDNLTERVNKLHTSIVNLQHSVSDVKGKGWVKGETVASSHARLNTHTSEIRTLRHSVHTIDTSISKLWKALGNQPTPTGATPGDIANLQHQINGLKKHTHAAYQFSLSAAPLLGLLPLTAVNLRNLNLLKNEPCQCEQVKGSSSPDVSAWVAANIAADGV